MESGDIWVSLYIKGVWSASYTFYPTSSGAWYTKTWTGTWTKAEVDAMQIKMVGDTNGNPMLLDAMYCTATYTAPVVPYNKVINGVSSYSHINGISVNDITAWNGVT